MIAALRSWLTAILATAVLLSVAEKLIPEGSVRKIASMTGGLLLLTVLVRPITSLRPDSFSLDMGDYSQAVQERQAELQAENENALSELIAERTAAYISDKAASLGINCRAEVTTAAGEDGVPRPDRVELSCGKSAALSAYIAEELGIPEERQVFHGDG